ncbi:putative MFS transporter [Aspergillus nomiae NRRL 13137]|uniref:Putative MFS transporter n=1 Tax=Aspergillus nomiae NRRL (strain ATCC 15546 / NRRL 13137 / CBS 260.88 / M93) TaxID=1509407 RepID=A0A0L1JEY4_ASPN3|nr:putative MFS transporter [Aspergillus nomiae NRRL 13137]KNG90384.1 putative MFS transporter [Aspergillus nomiae NRRL 13137]
MSLAQSQFPPADMGKNPDSGDIREQFGDNRDDVESGSEPDIADIERIYRKLDLRIIPAFWVLYFLCAAVRSNVSLAQTMNIDTNHTIFDVLHVNDHQSRLLSPYSTLSPHVWMSRIVISVGVIGTCMTAMKAAWSFYLLRLLLGIVIAGMWPGMAYYLTLFYPPSRTGKRIGQYYTAAQLSAAAVGLVSAGFQKMDGVRGYAGFQWMFLVWGVITIAVGILLLWWLPDRPTPPGEQPPKKKYLRWFPRSAPALTGRDAEIHYHDLKRVYHRSAWTLQDLLRVFLDWRLWPLLIMYFGVVGVGIGVQSYATVIIKAINPNLSGIDLSLLSAPIWLVNGPSRHPPRNPLLRPLPPPPRPLFLCPRPPPNPRPPPHHLRRHRHQLLAPLRRPPNRRFGLGPTVPITMTWTTEIFQPRHGEVGVAAASAIVSGLGNLGSIVTTYALYNGWAEDRAAPGRLKFRKSNLVMVGILCGSILAAVTMQILVRVIDGRKSDENDPDKIVDGAARREAQQRGLDGLGSGIFSLFKKRRNN